MHFIVALDSWQLVSSRLAKECHFNLREGTSPSSNYCYVSPIKDSLCWLTQSQLIGGLNYVCSILLPLLLSHKIIMGVIPNLTWKAGYIALSKMNVLPMFKMFWFDIILDLENNCKKKKNTMKWYIIFSPIPQMSVYTPFVLPPSPLPLLHMFIYICIVFCNHLWVAVMLFLHYMALKYITVYSLHTFFT